ISRVGVISPLPLALHRLGAPLRAVALGGGGGCSIGVLPFDPPTHGVGALPASPSAHGEGKNPTDPFKPPVATSTVKYKKWIQKTLRRGCGSGQPKHPGDTKHPFLFTQSSPPAW
ncbi:hypothetical protein DV515_00016374, partial [Chloebia gouldiae]